MSLSEGSYMVGGVLYIVDRHPVSGDLYKRAPANDSEAIECLAQVVSQLQDEVERLRDKVQELEHRLEHGYS